jgi:hypothetical protein
MVSSGSRPVSSVKTRNGNWVRHARSSRIIPPFLKASGDGEALFVRFDRPAQQVGSRNILEMAI